MYTKCTQNKKNAQNTHKIHTKYTQNNNNSYKITTIHTKTSLLAISSTHTITHHIVDVTVVDWLRRHEVDHVRPAHLPLLLAPKRHVATVRRHH